MVKYITACGKENKENKCMDEEGKLGTLGKRVSIYVYMIW
jgi:hypothetical protein